MVVDDVILGAEPTGCSSGTRRLVSTWLGSLGILGYWMDGFKDICSESRRNSLVMRV